MNACEFYKRLGPNFVTPNAISYTESKHFYVEISNGEILGVTLCGVTVRDCDKNDPYNLSKSFNTKEAATNYAHKIVINNRDCMYDDCSLLEEL